MKVAADTSGLQSEDSCSSYPMHLLLLALSFSLLSALLRPIERVALLLFVPSSGSGARPVLPPGAWSG